MLNPYSTTVHGSTFIGTSMAFCCNHCGSPVAHVVLPGGDVAYECQSTHCGKTVMLDCPEALAVRDEMTIELPLSRPTYVPLAC